MKRFLFIISLLLAGLALNSQNLVTEGEYFWDADPGEGNGISLSATDGSFDTALENLFLNGIDITSLSAGAHTFNVRVKGSDGTWSSVFRQVVYKDGALTAISRTVKVNLAEYFWDGDPGNGNGTPLLVFDGAYDNAVELAFKNDVDISALAPGAHSFNVRILGEDGTWSSTFRTTVYLDGPQLAISRTIKVNQVEYFWDGDPGTGNGTPLLVFDGAFDSALENFFKNNLDVSAMALGAHSFSVRIKGEDGGWSETFRTVVYLDGPQLAISRTVKVNQVEYFWDGDPGIGNGTPLLVFDGAFDSALENFFKNNLDVSAMALGAHSFSVRIKGEDGAWSETFRTTVYLDGPQLAISRTVKVNQVEYFWDGDPGTGNGTPLLVFDGAFDSTLENFYKNNVDISALSLGAHSFNVRIKGEDGNWSETFRTTVYLDGLHTTISRTTNVVQGEYFWDTDPGAGFATPLLSLDGSFDNALENLYKNGISTTGLSIGPHSFNVRVRGQDGTWSELFRQTIFVECGSPIAPTITISLYSSGACEGTVTVFQAVATNGGTTPVYTWYVNGTPAGTNSPFFSTSTLSNGDVITCELLSNSSCASPNNATSNAIVVTLSPVTAPTISISSSEGTSICTGTSVTFTATATNQGTTPFYQWKIDGVNAGTNSSTFTTSSLSNGDVVSCVLTSSDGCATPPTVNSNNLSMEVLNIVTPSVSISGSSGPTICTGTSVTFTATPAYGGTTPSYQWKKNGSDVGTNSFLYTDPGLTDGDVITCVMTSSRSCLTTPTATSNSITITVLPIVTASVSISSGGVTTICSGTPVTFTATPVNGGTTPDYNWIVSGISQGVNNSNFTTSSLSNGDVVYCYMTGSLACSTPSTATSNTITMTVNSSAPPVASITSDEGSTICEGTSVTFNATVTNGGSSPDYEWHLNGSTTGLNSPTYSNSSLNNGDVISCVITSNAVCVSGMSDESNLITMVVTDPVTPGITITSDQGASICSGTYVTFSASAVNEGSSPVYQWYVNGSATGFNSAYYSTSSLSDGDDVTCVLYSSLSCVTSSSASGNTITMDVTPSVTASVSISTGDPTEICEGTEVSFTASPVNGGTSPSYQWYVNGIPAGTNSTTFSSSSFADGDEVSLSMSGDMTCAFPSVANSNTIVITVYSTDAPTISISADPGTVVCDGSGVSFTAYPTNGGTMPEYEWYLNGVLTGDNSSVLNLASVNDGDEVYCSFTSNALCVSGMSATSSTLTMSVQELVTPSVVISSVQEMPVCDGETVEFNASVTNGGISPDYYWTINGFATGSNSPVFYAVSWNAGDQVACTITSSEVCVTTASAASNLIEISSVTVDDGVSVMDNILTSDQSGGAYQWYDCDGMIAISGATSQSYSVGITGDYAVEVTFNGCTVLSECIYVLIVNSEQVENYQIKIYPNPASSWIKIESNQLITEPVKIFDVSGKLLFMGYPDNNNNIGIEGLTSGSYVIEVIMSDKKFRQRFVKID